MRWLLLRFHSPAGGTNEHFWVPLVVLDQCFHAFDDLGKSTRGSPKLVRESSEGVRAGLPLVRLVRNDGRWTIDNRLTFRGVADEQGSGR